MVIKEMHQANTCKKKKQRNKKSSKKLTRKKTHGKHLTKNIPITKDKYNSNRKGIEEGIEHILEKVDPGKYHLIISRLIASILSYDYCH